VVTPDWFGETAHGSSLNPTKGYCLRVYSSSILSMLKILIDFYFLIFFYRVFFTSKKYIAYRVKYLITGILLTEHEKGVNFWGSIFPSKMGPIAPFLATIQPLSKARVFLLSENKQRLLCIGRTFTAN
jgi:hypothetical protein